MDKPEQILEAAGFDIDDLESEGTILYRNPDFHTAIIGVTTDYHAVYDYERMVEYLMIHENFTYEESVEWIDYNTLRTYSSEGLMPIVMYPVKQD